MHGTHKNCILSIVTTTDKTSLHKSIGEHNYLVNIQQKINQQILREIVKEKPTIIFLQSARQLKIIRTELVNNNSNLTDVKCSDIKSVRKAMYNEQFYNPRYPIHTVILVLKQIQAQTYIILNSIKNNVPYTITM